MTRIDILTWLYRTAHNRRLILAGQNKRIDFFDSDITFYDLLNDKNIQKKLTELKNGLDAESIRCLDNLLLNWTFLVDAELRNTCHESIDDSLYQRYFQEYTDAAAQAREKYFNKIDGPDCCLFQCGLYYAGNEIREYIRNKIFVDGGAFDGDSALVMNDFSPSKILAFEISEKSRKEYLKSMKAAGISSDRYELIPKGLGSCSETVSFNDTGNPGTTLMKKGSSTAEIIPLDDMSCGIDTVGFIKLDVEGVAFKAVQGMKNILKRDRPVLSIAIYHIKEEFFEVKPYVESLGLNYHFKVYHIAWEWSCGTHLLAYPAELKWNDTAEDTK